MGGGIGIKGSAHNLQLTEYSGGGILIGSHNVNGSNSLSVQSHVFRVTLSNNHLKTELSKFS